MTAKTEEQKSGGYANAARHRMHELVLNQPKRVFWYSAFATLNDSGEINSLIFDSKPHDSREEAFKRVQGTDTGVVAQVTLFSGRNPNQGPPSDQ